MKKSFGILLAVLFLLVQTVSVMHMAEHGFAEHKHSGHTCEIYLYCDHGKLAGASTIDIPADTTFTNLAPLPFAAPALAEEHHDSSAPRAPPLFS